MVGIHFFNPAQVMRLVEIVRALQTSDETVERATAFAVACRKRTVLCVDTPGFIVNRINIVAMREAVRMAEAKEATYEDIDKAMMLGMRHPMGPLRLADFVGLVRVREAYVQDICLQCVAAHLTQCHAVHLRCDRRAAVRAARPPPPHGAGRLARRQVGQGTCAASTHAQGFYDHRAKA